MKYGVKALAKISGLTVRTLHFYDQIGLLKPAYYERNGYRVYEEKELLLLQQILFFRELGFELKQIKRILRHPDFDLEGALLEHRRVLEQNAARTRKLIRTIDQTLKHLKGTKKMNDQAMFAAFDDGQQSKYEQQLIDRYGDTMREGIEESKKKVKNWSREDWARAGGEWDAICQELVEAMKGGLTQDSREVQALVRRHFEWLKRFWTPDQESYAAHAEFIVTSDLRNAYDKYDPMLAAFLAGAMKKFAQRELG